MSLQITWRSTAFFACFIAYTTPIAVRISLAKAISKPPNRQRTPCVRCVASWDCTDIPSCTTPQPRMIMPIALMQLKMKSDRLFTMVSGSVSAAKADVVKIAVVSTSPVQ